MSFYSLKYKKPQTYTFLFVWKQTLQYPLIWIAINVFKENNFKFMSLLWRTADVKNVFLCIRNITKIEAICQLFVILGDCRFSRDLFLFPIPGALNVQNLSFIKVIYLISEFLLSDRAWYGLLKQTMKQTISLQIF